MKRARIFAVAAAITAVGTTVAAGAQQQGDAPVQPGGPGWGYMGPWMMGPNGMAGWGWWMPFHGILSLLMLVLVIAALVALVRFIFGGGHGFHHRRHSSGLDVLEERYAKGEIQRDEYLQKKRDLGG